MSSSKTLAEQLLAQAERLAGSEEGSATEADLRRSISSAYYALFHLLAGACVMRLAGAAPDQQALRHCLVRTLDHKVMKTVCGWFGEDNLPDSLKGLPHLRSIPTELRSVASAFVELQHQRHLADYSTESIFVWADAVQCVSQAKAAFAAWANCKEHAAAEVFLLSLFRGDKLSSRR